MSRERQRGTRFETEVVNYLHSLGFHAARTGSAAQDKGDIAGFPGLTIECKNCREMRLAEWVDQVEHARTPATIGVVVHKRARANIAKAYVTMSLNHFLALLPQPKHFKVDL